MLHLVEQAANSFNNKCMTNNQSLAWSLAKAARLFQDQLFQGALTCSTQNVPFSEETVKRPYNQPAILY